MKNICLSLTLLLCWTTIFADQQLSEALLKSGKIKGGLALVANSSATSVKELVEKHNLFVQFVLADDKKIVATSKEFEKLKLSNKINLVNHDLKKAPYVTQLFNLISIGNQNKEFSKEVSFKELNRILAPQGIICIQNISDNITKELSQLSLKKVSTSGTWTFFEKNRLVKNTAIAPSNSLRWLAPPRSHRMTLSFQTVAISDRYIVYRQLMAQQGEKEYVWVVFARDTFNGREIWRRESSPFKPRRGAITRRVNWLAVSNSKVFTLLNGALTALDIHTGKTIYPIEYKANFDLLNGIKIDKQGSIVAILNRGKVRVFDQKNGKALWDAPGTRFVITKENLISLRRQDLIAYDFKGKRLWSINLMAKESPLKRIWTMFLSDNALHLLTDKRKKDTVHTLDIKTGKTIWTYTPKRQIEYVPNKKKRQLGDYHPVNFGDEVWLTFQEQNNPSVKMHITILDAQTGKVKKENITPEGHGDTTIRCFSPKRAGDYLLYGSNIFVHRKTFKLTNPKIVRPYCFEGHKIGNGYVFSMPFHKHGRVKSINATGPKDLPDTNSLGGKTKLTYDKAPENAKSSGPKSWTIFRGSLERNSVYPFEVGSKINKKWQKSFGIKKPTYGTTSLQRTGITQAIQANKIVIISSIDDQIIYALDEKNGNTLWTFPVGSQVSFSPSIYKGMCYFGSKNGWVYCLNLKTGTLIWKLMAAPEKRFLGAYDKVESHWPVNGDIFIDGGIGYVNAGRNAAMDGGLRYLTFKPETGDVIWSKILQNPQIKHKYGKYSGLFIKGLDKSINFASGKIDAKGSFGRNHRIGDCLNVRDINHYLAGNHIKLTARNHNTSYVFRKIKGRSLSFTNDFIVGTYVNRAKSNYYEGTLGITAYKSKKTKLWTKDDIKMNIDGIVITKNNIVCVGHYELTKQKAELWVLNKTDGKLIQKIELDLHPAFDGLSISNDTIYIAGRQGNLASYQISK